MAKALKLPVLLVNASRLVKHFQSVIDGINFTKEILRPWSVSIVALQLAIYVDLKKIFLFGIHHDWQCIAPYLHFYDHNKPSLEYYLKEAHIEIPYEVQQHPFPKERLYKEYELYQQYETLKQEAEQKHMYIYNSDPQSHFDVFDKKEYE